MLAPHTDTGYPYPCREYLADSPLVIVQAILPWPHAPSSASASPS